ncbi:hypothetical protein EDB89DRAFT_387545 [Lactarius sanguifluus]|nr:hypothetical protein EDB89DRAFT_671860 [Lactarius sanguifluus]KAH9164807.1 hypothetical protein EDB89DRAFT_387545 [Lactarius sanguifluus]
MPGRYCGWCINAGKRHFMTGLVALSFSMSLFLSLRHTSCLLLATELPSGHLPDFLRSGDCGPDHYPLVFECRVPIVCDANAYVVSRVRPISARTFAPGARSRPPLIPKSLRGKERTLMRSSR